MSYPNTIHGYDSAPSNKGLWNHNTTPSLESGNIHSDTLCSSGYSSSKSLCNTSGQSATQYSHLHDDQQPLEQIPEQIVETEYECNLYVEGKRLRIISDDLDLVQTSASILSDFFDINAADGGDFDDSYSDTVYNLAALPQQPMLAIDGAPKSPIHDIIVVSDSEDCANLDNRSRRTHFSNELCQVPAAVTSDNVPVVYNREELKVFNSLAASNYLPDDWVQIAQRFPDIVR